MTASDSCFIPFAQDISSHSLPEAFTFPFYYQPHPLCILAAEQLQHYIETQTEWQHDFGLTSGVDGGKMFGVLLVRNSQGEVGYLAAFSGKLADGNHWSHFVPPVFDMLDKTFFIEQQAVINDLTQFIEQLESNRQINYHQATLAEETAQSEQAIAQHRADMIEGRKQRKLARQQGQATLNEADYKALCDQLAAQSIFQKKQLAALQQHWQERITAVEDALEAILAPIKAIKQKRKDLSVDLQATLFGQYQFLNSAGKSKSIADIFGDNPPAGAGECAAPKLLQYAFSQQFTPLAMAEFWWGASPKSAIRQHRQFYPACKNKCEPILAHMLAGMAIDDNPLVQNQAENKQIEIVYQDDEMVVINKPFDMLSVPGKSIKDCVQSRMRQQFPDATGPLIVHRLDMATSGLMVIALSDHANKQLVHQFIKRTVKKRYVALLDGTVEQEIGHISLPLRVDLDDRPRQLVCYEYGRVAETDWQLIEYQKGKTKVYFYPKTGRTHQLRVHAAHSKGLNCPIVGDDLYGNSAERLHLHADYLCLKHPVTQEVMEFQVEPEF